ncbi:phosphate ABC transporter permease PstA [Alkalibacillus silvisoli]|uniref:Phosphate transport system permease protein PstA n=1 Tax=Alkalibacillus silvisoli TaxID=392823 RepID=A0ABP3K3G3_9BACI
MTNTAILRKKQIKQNIWISISYTFALITVITLCLLFYWILRGGAEVISWSFITQMPQQNMTAGGIWPAIVGTVYVSVLTITISVPLGIGAAIYLNEYAKQGRLVRMIRLAIRNLSGVPSIVYGLFGLGLFAATLGFGRSLLAAALTLSIMVLPWVITGAEEALKSVPRKFREGGLALGATKWQTIRQLVLPPAIPGMATGAILGLARAAGETAPIILTGAAYYLPIIPHDIKEQFMALPYHLYILVTQHSETATVRPIAFGTALVLIALVILLNSFAIMIRNHFRKKNELL